MNSAARLTRWSRMLALAGDLGGLVAALGLVGVVALGWLFVRSNAGRDDIAEFDALRMAAIVLAAPPAWFAWYASGAAWGCSPGQRRAGLGVEGSTSRRWLRLVLHPLAVPLWGWLALVAAATGLAVVALGLLVAAALVAIGGSISLVRWIAWPGERGIHDLLAGTRLVTARPPAS